MDILRVLVSNHESKGGVGFFFSRSTNGADLIYGGASIPVGWNETDLIQLKQFGLITLIKHSAHLYSGKPTHFGITAIRGQAAETSDERHQEDVRGEPLAWPPVVHQWERIKADRKLDALNGERIPEADLRRIVADLNRIQPEDVTEAQIDSAAEELAHHYGRFRIVPAALGAHLTHPGGLQNPTVIADADFWREREEEFRRYDPLPDVVLCATWFSWGNHWMVYTRSDASAFHAENTFKSLGREAARGLGSQRGAESWKDWLDLLRLASDEETGRLVYAEDTQSSRVMSEGELRRCIEAGEVVPAGEQIEYIETRDGGIDKRMCWETTDSTMKNLFKISAEHCLRLRSLVAHPETKADVSRGEDMVPGAGPPTEGAKPDEETLGGGSRNWPVKTYKTAAGSNIDRLRKECGWSFDELAAQTGLEKKLILSHVNDGVRARPKTLKIYADAFTRGLKHPVHVADIEASP